MKMEDEPAQLCYRAVIRGPHTWKASPPDPNVNSLMTPSALVIEPKTSLAVMSQGLVEIPNLCINSDQKNNPQILSVLFFPTPEIAQEALHIFTKAMEIDDCIYDVCKNGKVVGVLKLALGSFCVPLDAVVNRTKFTAGNVSNPKKVTGTPCSNAGGRAGSDVGANDNCDSYHLRVTVSPSTSLLQKETDLHEVIRKSVQMQSGNTNRLSLVFFKLDRREPITKSHTPLILFSRSNTNYPPPKSTPTIYTRSKTAVLCAKDATQSLKPDFIGGILRRNEVGAQKFGKQLVIKRVETQTANMDADNMPSAINTGSTDATRHRGSMLLPNVGSLETAAATIDTLVDVGGGHKRAVSAHEHISSREDGDVLVTSLANPKFKGIDVGTLVDRKENAKGSRLHARESKSKVKDERSPNEFHNSIPKLEEIQQKHKQELENQKAQFEQHFNKLRLEHEASISSMLANHGTIVKGLEEQLKVTNQQLQNVMADADRNTRDRMQAVEALETELKLLQTKSQSTIETLQHTLELESQNKQGLVDMTRRLQQEYEELKQATESSNLEYIRRINELQDTNQRLVQDLKAQELLTRDARESECEIKSKYDALVEKTREASEREQYLSSELQRLVAHNAQIDAQRQVLLEKTNEEINEWITKYKEAIEEIDSNKKREVSLMVEIDRLKNQNQQLSRDLKLQQEAHIASMGALNQDAKSEWAAMYEEAKATADSLQSQRSDLCLELENARKRNQQLEEELQVQLNSARDVISENNAWVAKYKSALEDIDSLRRSEADLTAELSKCKCLLQQKTVEFETLRKSTLESHTLEVKRLESLHQIAAAELSATNSQKQDLQARLEQVLVELEHVKNINDSMSSAHEQSRIELQQCKEQIAHLECQGQGRDHELAKLQSKLVEVNTKYHDLVKEHESTVKSLGESEEAREKQSATLARLEQEKHLLERLVVEKQKLLAHVQESIDHHINDKLVNENERFKLQEKLQTIETKYNDLVGSLNNSQRDLETLKLDKEQAVEQLGRALERCNALQSANETIAKQRDFDILELTRAKQQLETRLREGDVTIADLTSRLQTLKDAEAKLSHLTRLYKLNRARFTLTTGCLRHQIQIKQSAIVQLAELLVLTRARYAKKCLQRNREGVHAQPAKHSSDYCRERDAWISRKMAEFEKLKLLHIHSKAQSTNAQDSQLDGIRRDVKLVLNNQAKLNKDLSVLFNGFKNKCAGSRLDGPAIEQGEGCNGSSATRTSGKREPTTASSTRLVNSDKHDLGQLETMSSFGREFGDASYNSANYRENRAFVLRRLHVEKIRGNAASGDD